MNKRPLSITLICWYLIISETIYLISIPFSLNNPDVRKLMEASAMPLIMQYVMMGIGLFIIFSSSIAMLKGKNWARILYVTWSIIGFTLSVATAAVKTVIIPGIIIFLIIAFFLFRPKADEYFKTDLPPV